MAGNSTNESEWIERKWVWKSLEDCRRFASQLAKQIRNTFGDGQATDESASHTRGNRSVIVQLDGTLVLVRRSSPSISPWR